MTADTRTIQAGVNHRLRGGRRPLRERAFGFLLMASVALAVAFLAALLAYVLGKGWDRLDSRLWQEQPTFILTRVDQAGVQSALYGTLWVVTFMALFTVPIGVLAAIYLQEYANPNRWVNRLIELNIQNLAAAPSIIYGILGLGLVARGPLDLGFVVLAASMTLALLVLPVVVISSREAIKAVPESIRHASLALGATQWQTIRRQVLPAAIPGIATGTILGLSRAIGEAAPLIMLGAVTFVTFNPDGLGSQYGVLPIQILNLLSRPQEGFQAVGWAAVILLLAILLLMNSLAIYVRNRYQKRW